MRILREAVILSRMLLAVSARRAFALLSAAALAAACTTLQQPGPPKESGQLVFWQAESDAHPGARAWLLGSLHVAAPDLVFDPAIESALAGSQALVMEAEVPAPDTKEGSAFIDRAVSMATLPEGQTLDQLLPQPTWDHLADFLRERGAPVDAYRRLKPWFMMTMVVASLAAESGLQAGAGIDHRIEQASQGRIPVIALETAESQLALLDSLPIDVQAQMLGDVIDRQKETRQGTERLFEAWKLGDLGAIEREVVGEDASPKVREFQEKIYTTRNKAMVQHLDELLAQPKTLFVVIGAGHMVGADGIPSLLAARGYRVTRIAKTPAPQ